MTPSLPNPVGLIGDLRKGATRTGHRLTNGYRVLSGQDQVTVATTPRHEIWRSGQVRLYRYAGAPEKPAGPPVLLIMSLVTKPDIFDLMPEAGLSLVRAMQKKGLPVYLLDWGVPGSAEAKNRIADYALGYLPRAIRHVSADSGGSPVNLFCYCMGGTLALLAAASGPRLPIAGILSVATPIDFTQLGPIPNLVRNGTIQIEHLVDDTGNISPQTVARAIKLVKPTGDLTTVLSLWDALADQQALYAHRALMGWAGGHIPFPGAAAEEFVEFCMRRNTLSKGEMPLGTVTAQLSDIRCRVFSIFGTEDALVPPSAHSMLSSLLTNADFRELSMPTGHVGLFVGRQARQATAAMLEWLLEPDSDNPPPSKAKSE